MIGSPRLSSIPNIRHGFGTRLEEDLPAGLVTARQVHGNEILFLKSGKDGARSQEGFDILMTDRTGIAIAVKTADCLPVLMVEPVAGIVAAVHAGWKGTLVRTSQKAVERIVAQGGEVSRIATALGPSYGGRCYEVGADVAELFEKEFPGWSSILNRKGPSKWLLDVAETNRLQLMEAGLAPERIDHIDLCTHCRPDLFYSFREEGEKAGRMVSFIELSPSVSH